MGRSAARREPQSRLARFKDRWLPRLMSIYPPYLGAGIRVRSLPPEEPGGVRSFETRMKLHWWNRNLVGTQFGGSLYSMCDPFYMLILYEALGEDHIVWDKVASIRFRRPGRGTVRARFRIPAERIDEIRRAAAEGDKVEPVFAAQVIEEESGEVVAVLEKTVYVRRKDAVDD